MKKFFATLIISLYIIGFSSFVIVVSNSFQLSKEVSAAAVYYDSYKLKKQKLLSNSEDYLIRCMLFSGLAFSLLIIYSIVLLLKSQKNYKKSIVELENSNLLMQTFIDAHKNLIYLKDESLKYALVNRSFLNVYNMSQHDIIGMNDFDISNLEFANIKRQTDQAVLEKMELITDELIWQGRVYLTTKFPVTLLNGRTGVGATIRDVTEEREQERYKQKVYERNNIQLSMFHLNFYNVEEQLDYALHNLLTLTESEYGHIYLYDEKTDAFHLQSQTSCVFSGYHIKDASSTCHFTDTEIRKDVIKQRKPIVINDNRDCNFLFEHGNPDGHGSFQNFMSIPIIVDQEIVAVIGLGNKKSDYNEHDIMNATILMNGVLQAIQKKEAEVQLLKERKKYFQTLISIGDGILVVDMDGNVEMLNMIAQKLTGFTNQEAYGKHYKEIFVLSHENEALCVSDPIETVFQTNEIYELQNHAVLTSKNGKQYDLEDCAAPILNQKGETEGVVLIFRDVTEKRKQKEEIEYLSYYDALTGLHNRRFFEDALQCIDLEENLPISIVMADVNRLKLTNDVFGHVYGDQLLKTVAEVFQHNCRYSDVIARWGGDEFVLLLPQTTQKAADNIVLRLKEDFTSKRIQTIQVSVAMGSSSKVDINENILDILDAAEEKMYANKTMEREAIKDEDIKSILHLLHTSSPREKEHSNHVRELSTLLGNALKLPDVELRQLKEAAYLHDIGKIILDNKLLQSYDPLTETENTEIKRHPVVGFRILNTSDKTLDLAETILTHHEHWDGSGYPKGLKQTEIPLFARIIAVVNYYDRMTYHFNGSEKEKKWNALHMIQNSAGKQFDPCIVKIFIDLMNSDANYKFPI